MSQRGGHSRPEAALVVRYDYSWTDVATVKRAIGLDDGRSWVICIRATRHLDLGVDSDAEA
jgi:hypothetical protein